MATNVKDCIPVHPIHPGGILKEELEARGYSQKEFAAKAGIMPSHLNEVIKGKRRINVEFAVKLEDSLGIPYDFWMRFQNQYDYDVLRCAERDARNALERYEREHGLKPQVVAV